jgi:NAD(P)-dependent dehydrogenase (short-subunit alcohol dehydrogenase family)
MSAPEREAVIDVDFRGVNAAARAGVSALLRRPVPRCGRFIAVSSAAAARSMPGLAAYSASKGGVVSFIRGLAADSRGAGITANAVAPGSTRTPLIEESARLHGLSSGQDFSPQQPLERLLEPEEVASMIAWSAGVESGGATGANLPVDGGLSV